MVQSSEVDGSRTYTLTDAGQSRGREGQAPLAGGR